MQKSKNRKFAFIINYGIEYRMFLISGLIKELSKNNEIIVIKRNIQNNLFNEYKLIYNFEVLNLEKTFFEKKRLRIENIFQSIRQSRIKILGKTPFKNYNIKKNKITFKDILKGNIITYTMFKIFTINKIKKEYKSLELENILQNNNITDMILSGYSSTSSINFAINSLNNQIKVWTFINSWKDYYINDFLPYKSNGFFVWSEAMKNDFLSTNSHINDSTMYTIGNIVFDRFYDPIIYFEKEYYENKYNFKNTDKIFLYCMLDPDRYRKEEEIILLISKELNKIYKNNFKILVKKNPFDSSSKVNDFFKDNNYISVLEHFSQRDKKNDFFIQSFKGEKEWIDVLYYSDYVLGAASTVALEAIMMKKSVFTISFNKDGKENSFLRSLCEIDFYKEILKREDVHLSSNINQFIKQIELNKKAHESTIPKILGIFDGKSLDKVIDIMGRK